MLHLAKHEVCLAIGWPLSGNRLAPSTPTAFSRVCSSACLGLCRRPLRHAEGEEGQQGGARRKRRTAADSNPSATLEPSWEALNVKKFDLVFAVDPLFHRMSAQFDEGGARGGGPAGIF